MTATCPPALRSEILSTLGIGDTCHVIHAPTDRPEISYSVKLSPTLDEAKESLVKAVQDWIKKRPSSFRGLVYCRSKAQVEEIASMIGCKAFHADRPAEERVTSFKDWTEGRESFLVCTSLLGCGIDVEGVGIVFHFGTPWSILDFVQESGRAGRGGKHSFSIVYASKDERDLDRGDNDPYGKATMREWVLQNTVCRRTALSTFLDNRRVTCTLLKGAVFCDVCSAESLRPHPGRLVAFSTLTTPTGDIPRLRKPLTIPPSSLEYAIAQRPPIERTRWVILILISCRFH